MVLIFDTKILPINYKNKYLRRKILTYILTQSFHGIVLKKTGRVTSARLYVKNDTIGTVPIVLFFDFGLAFLEVTAATLVDGQEIKSDYGGYGVTYPGSQVQALGCNHDV